MPVMKKPLTAGMPLAMVTAIFGPVPIEAGMRVSTCPPVRAGLGTVAPPTTQTNKVRKGASDG
jgi:hypothetical protein